jgi:hypothetical protein
MPKLPDYLQFWMLMGLGALIFVPATLLTRAEDMDRLVRYYVMTRPLGWWGPVHAEAVRRGLIESHAPARRFGLRRTWTAEEADAWSLEDGFAIVASPLAFGLIMIGLAKLLLLQWEGLWLLLAAGFCIFVMFALIDPKLRALSADYEARQAEYLRTLDVQLLGEK